MKGQTPKAKAKASRARGSERGYESFKELVRDVEGLVDVVWVSGTRMFPYPYPYPYTYTYKVKERSD